MRKISITALILITIAGFISHAWGFDFQEGRYEVISTIKMPGMPMQPAPVTITRCMTSQDPVPGQSAADSNCRIVDTNTQGNTVTWKVECDHQGQKMKGSGKMTYHGDHFEGMVNAVMAGQGGNMEMTTTIKGKRVGPCE